MDTSDINTSEISKYFTQSLGTTSISIYDIASFIVIICATFLIARIVTNSLTKTLKEKLDDNELNLIRKILFYGIVITGFLVALPNIISDVSGLLLAGGVFSIIIGFASQSTVSNLVSGLFLIIEHPIKVGDKIVIEDEMGYVDDIRILSTIIRTYEGKFVRFPNEKVFNSKIINYVTNVAIRFEYTVNISYQDNGDKAVQVIKDVIEKEPYILKNPAPYTWIKNLGDNGVDIVARMWAPSWDYWNTEIVLLLKIKDALESEGIEIPFPQRVVWFAEDDPKKCPDLNIPLSKELQ
ncbi:mechanosensitive ion channel family protein [Methanoplanus sp. FWC-SCC4]|uniref:Mechanosensitive ion channel family protein n=1 Tax=Methanochimaera problematica TaxID=2609417 RepID=A0AA97I2Z0_9EURY|nr:mechanosensitive ion channel family protein [Methanoplanus sp. FWC-SCC4]WOF16108.1 mechanosensitive ion channel family protein [Methanoplanus sp. FWC-SCC4]